MCKKHFDEKNINAIIQKLKRKNLIFSNEEQFRDVFVQEVRNQDLKVTLEVVSSDKELNKFAAAKKNSRIKCSTDIVVEVNKGQYVLIELKYCLKDDVRVFDVNGKKIITFAQGALNMRAKNFWEDVAKLENFTCSTHWSLNFASSPEIKETREIIGCYALMLTNGEIMWDNSKGKKSKCIYYPVPKKFKSSANNLIKNDYDKNIQWNFYNTFNAKFVFKKTSKKPPKEDVETEFRYLILQVPVINHPKISVLM